MPETGERVGDDDQGVDAHPAVDVGQGDDRELNALEDDLEAVDAALEALDADDLDAAESLVASLADLQAAESLVASLADDGAVDDAAGLPVDPGQSAGA